MEKYQKFISEIQNISQNAKLSMPLKIEIAITDRCNQKCKHCSNKNKLFYHNTYVSDEIIEKIIEANPIMVVLTGGEPFLHPNFFHFVKRLKEKDIFIRILSNGLLANKGNIKKLINAGFTTEDVLQISLDGASRETYYLQRGVDHFEQVCSNVKLLIRQNINIEIHTVPTQNNYKEIIKIIKVAEYLGCSKISIGSFAPFSEQDLKLMCDSRMLEKINQEINKNRYKYKISIKNKYIGEICSSEIYLNEKKRLFPNSEKKHIYSCAACTSSCYINEIGEVFPCVYMSDERMKIGSLKKESILQIWNGEFAHRYQINWNMENSICGECEYWNWCTGGCLGVSAAYVRKLQPGYDPRCYKKNYLP